MSYRNYLFIADKKKVSKLKKMTLEQLWELVDKEPDYLNRRKDGTLYPPYHRDITNKIDAEELLEISSAIYYKDSEFKVENYLTKVFQDKSINNYYNQEMDFMIAKSEILEGLIEFYIAKTKKYYQQLSKEDSENQKNEFGDPLEPQLKRLQHHVKVQLSWLNCVNNSDSRWCLSSSWLYEYDIFNLIHIKKMFNPKKQVLLWMGW